MKKRDELIHKEKLEVAATLQAAASAASNVHHHPFSFHRVIPFQKRHEKYIPIAIFLRKTCAILF